MNIPIWNVKPHIRILPDQYRFYYCGWFPGGYSSLAKVGTMSIAEVIQLYFRILKYET